MRHSSLSANSRATVLVAFLLCAALTRAFGGSGYDPLTVPSSFKPEIVDLTIKDTARQRDIPIRVYLPQAKAPAPVIIFSHGLGGSREGSAYLGDHWSARGYVAVFPQHLGSDTSVWKDKAPEERMGALRQAAGLQNFLLRVKDIPVTLDQLEQWNTSGENVLKGRLDLKHVGMSGHSFGAVTTQAVSGQAMTNGAPIFTDERIKAVLMMSPSRPHRTGDLGPVFGGVKIPWMLMTGTKDVSPVGDADAASRIAVYPALPSGGKYEVVLDGAEHSAFGDRPLPGDSEPRNPNHHRVILALSTAFWDTWLRDDAAAKAWLEGNGPTSVLEKGDRWQHK